MFRKNKRHLQPNYKLFFIDQPEWQKASPAQLKFALPFRNITGQAFANCRPGGK